MLVKVDSHAMLEAFLPRAERLALEFCDYRSGCECSLALAALPIEHRAVVVHFLRSPEMLLLLCASDLAGGPPTSA